MPKFKNVSPLGALDLPLIRRVVDRGEVITVTAAQAKHLHGQTATWKPVASSNRTGGQTPPDPDAGAAGDDNQSEE
ncbi:hypothetical protein APR04_003801 [Promicromonospora umidemergens]|uniref:ATP-grasp target RiPP n=1 Tax=Promicromonospora umidemergens TaxID=629679 RepID=A0ABP8XH91_9MICO|nr:hypothetical protein [Promicromonospora umidemergens]MCP2284878.1 hypothetical protein [Promicromonospora umidemergens]